MLEQLDAIHWQRLDHAYGEASDVPDLIRALASRDEETRQGALYALYGTIWHQGTVYEATSYAVPFLIELLANDDVQGKEEILQFLVHLAHGHSYKAVHQSFEARMHGEHAVNNPQYQAEMQVELYWVKQAHDAVAEGRKTYVSLLEHPDPAVRMGVPYTLASLAEHATEILPVVHARLEIEHDPQVRASLLLCMGLLATDRSQEYTQYFYDMVKAQQEQDLVRLAAAMALVRLEKENTPADVIQRLVEAITHPEEIEETYSTLPWNESGLVADICVVLCHLEPAAASIALSPCLEALKKADAFSALSLTRTLLYFVFGRHPFLKGKTARDLTDAQRTVLTMLVACDQAWTINANMAGILEAAGLPRRHKELRTFLEERGTM